MKYCIVEDKTFIIDFLNKNKSYKEHEFFKKYHASDKTLYLGCFDKNLIGFIGIYDYRVVGMVTLRLDYMKADNIIDLIHHALYLTKSEVFVEDDSSLYEYYLDEGFVFSEGRLKKVIIEEKPFSSYDEVHSFIASQKSRVYSLDHFKAFMNEIGNPQMHLKCIHIGGTNGKGSTTNFIRSALQEGDYCVGTFTSPALSSRLEVMRINNNPIDEKEIISYASRYMNLCLEYELSMFEIEVFISIMFFLHHHVDYALFEVGLGGELDATNIISPMISAITNIGLDHIDYLGDTYEKIATTKAGIIKENILFVTGEKKKLCLDIFQSISRERHTQMYTLENITGIKETQKGYEYHYRHYHVHLQSFAYYQIENSALALEVIYQLKKHSLLHLSDESIVQGINKAIWLGRFETVCKNPLIIVDGAHNKEGMEAFCKSAKKFSHIKIIFSALKDKDTHGMIEKMLEITNDITICEFDFYRAQTAEKLAEDFPVKIEKDWHKAIDDCFCFDGVVFVTGSLYFISQVRPYIINHRKEYDLR